VAGDAAFLVIFLYYPVDVFPVCAAGPAAPVLPCTLDEAPIPVDIDATITPPASTPGWRPAAR